jgi:hypothetical protein
MLARVGGLSLGNQTSLAASSDFTSFVESIAEAVMTPMLTLRIVIREGESLAAWQICSKRQPSSGDRVVV